VLPRRQTPTRASRGTGKDRDIWERAHKLLEGALGGVLAGFGRGCTDCLHLYPRRVYNRRSGARRRSRRALRRRLERQNACGSGTTSKSIYIAARAPIVRRGTAMLRKPRRPRRDSAPEAALSGGGRPLWGCPSTVNNGRDDRRPHRQILKRGGCLVASSADRRQHRHQDILISAMSSSVPCRRSDEHPMRE